MACHHVQSSAQVTSPKTKVRQLFTPDYVTTMAAICGMLQQDFTMQVYYSYTLFSQRKLFQRFFLDSHKLFRCVLHLWFDTVEIYCCRNSLLRLRVGWKAGKGGRHSWTGPVSRTSAKLSHDVDVAAFCG